MTQFTFTDPSATSGTNSDSFEQIPDCLKGYDHWLVVDLSGDRKPPVTRLRRRSDFSPTHVASLLSFAEAVQDCGSGEAVAFQFSETPYFGLAWDDVALDKSLTSPAEGLLGALREDFSTYTEWSTSGTGFHSVGRGALLDGYGHETDLSKVDAPDAHVEAYDSARYFVFTGEAVSGFPDEVRDCEQALHQFQKEWLSRQEEQGEAVREKEVSAGAETVYRTVQEYAKTDHALAQKAQRTLDLWHETPSREYEDSSSEDDASFVNLVYFWSKGDTGLVDECWQASERYDKKARRSD